MFRSSQVLGRLTWVVLALVFVGMLGGMHPSDRTRDVVVGVAAVLVVLLNLPGALVGVRRRGGWTTTLLPATARLLAAACVLLFIRSISHEERNWETKDASRWCHGTDVRWPDDPTQRCRVLHMCMNEAALAPGDDLRFRDLIATTIGCPPP